MTQEKGPTPSEICDSIQDAYIRYVAPIFEDIEKRTIRHGNITVIDFRDKK